jgi:hemolysin activation/secretion protein
MFNTPGYACIRHIIQIPLMIIFLWTAPGFAEHAGLDPTGRSGDPPPQFEPSAPAQPPEFKLPPVEPPSEDVTATAAPSLRVWISDIEITGNTVIPSSELEKVAQPYLNRRLAAEDIEALRRALTVYYIDRGYINSGAVIPDQTLSGGRITIRIIEGELSRIQVHTSGRLRPGYVESRLRLDAGPPLNITDLQRRMQLLQTDVHIERLNAELKPGLERGQAELDVKVEETFPYQLWFRVNNYQSPSIGAERAEVTGIHNNVLGFGDIFSLTLGGSDGVRPKIDVSYAFPLNAYETTLSVQYRKNDFNSVEARFKPLDIQSQSDIYTMMLRQPLYRTLSNEFALGFTLEHLENKSYLLDEPFSFSYGVVDGVAKVTAFRFSQEFIQRSQSRVLALTSRFSFGLDAWDATTHNNSDIPDGQFFDWLGQFQWVNRWSLWNSQSIFRTDVQVSNEPLFSLEQIAVGGRYSVRGYRENQLVRDNGLIASLEWRIPIVKDTSWADVVHLAPFVDYGKAWNTKLETPYPDDIASAGFGLRWERRSKSPSTLHPQFEIYWGIPFKSLNGNSDWNLQDVGIHFQLSLSVF